MTAAQRSRVKLEEEFAGEDTVPGKKLPIWKKRTSAPPGMTQTQQQQPPAVTNSATGEEDQGTILPDEPTGEEDQGTILADEPDSLQAGDNVVLTPVAAPPPGAKLIPINLGASAPSRPSQVAMEPTGGGGVVASRAYTRTSNQQQQQGKDGPCRIPRKIREMQENLNFEKIRRTGVKKDPKSVEWSSVVGSNNDNMKDMSVEEIREFMEEQRKRLGDDGMDDDDYYDNDAGMADDDYPEEEDEEVRSPSSAAATPSKPILKQERREELPSPVAPRKSVRFSLRPGSVPTPQNIDAASPTSVTTPPKKRGRKVATTTTPEAEALQATLDNTVDVFNQAAEEEEEEKDETLVTTRSGRVVRMRGTQAAEDTPWRRSSRSPKSESPPTKKRKMENGGGGGIKTIGAQPDHTKLVMEVLKKNPDLFKENKQVKLKVMAKDAQGKSVMQYITLKASDAAPPAANARETGKQL